MTDIPLTIQDAATALRSGSITSVQLTEASIERANRLDKELGVYIARTDETALEAAANADANFAAGIDRGPLQGIPLAIKDIISTEDAPTTAQSLVLDPNWGDQGDAPVTARMRAAGAVLTGKTSTMEFANGLPDTEKPFPIPRNPWNPSHWTGGSSSGTGNGIAAGLFYGGLGTDTGGSIRGPSSWCGITGIKPTYGRVPKSGCTYNGYSLDHIGPMARAAWDCAALLQVIAGYDASDPTCADMPVPDYVAALDGSIAGMRFGVEREHGLAVAQSGVAARFEEALKVLESLGAELVDVSIPRYDIYGTASTVISGTEKFIYHQMDMRTRWTDYGRWTRFSSSTGAFLKSSDYVQALRVRSLAAREVAELMAPFDAILTPAAATTAPALEGLTYESNQRNRASLTSIWNFLGLPSISTPMGLVDGLPIGLLISAKGWQDATALKIADAYQRATDWHLQVPELAAAVAA